MQARQQQQQSLNIRAYLTIFFKHKWKILICFVLVAGITCILARNLPRQFAGRAVVMVKFGREFVQVSEVGDAKPPSMSPDAIINTEVQILTGRDLMEKVVDAIGPETLYPELEKNSVPPAARRETAILNFQRNLLVNPIKGSNLIEVSFQNENPAVAAQVVNNLIEMLKEKHLQVFSDPKSSFLEAQLKEYQEKLKKSESDIENFKQRNQVFALDDQKSILLQERAKIETELKDEQSAINGLQQKISFLKDKKDVFSDAVVSQERTNLNGLEQRKQELAAKYNDNSVMMADHERQMQVVRKQLEKDEEQARNTEMTKIQADLEPSKVKVAGLQKRYNEVARELQQLDGRSREFEDLKREETVNESNYQIYLKKSEEARISEDLDRRKMTNVSVIEQASVPVIPVESKRKKIFGIGAFLSIALSLGLAYAAEYMPHGMTTPLEVPKRLGLPVLVPISYRKALRPAAGPDMEDEMITLYQTIASSLPDIEHRSILFMGSRSNEGTTTIARELARTVSLRIEKTVLLIDLDRSRPDLHVYANLKQERNFDEIVGGNGEIEEAICRVQESSLYVMPLFQGATVTPRTLEFARGDRFWGPLRERFDLIIVDTPPATMFPEGPGMVSMVDGVVLVVEAEKTRWPVALNVKEKTEQGGGRILGVVFNKRKYYIPEWLYRRI